MNIWRIVRMQAATVLLVAAAMTQVAHAKPIPSEHPLDFSRAATLPAAGPWYTPQELRALIAQSGESSKHQLLLGGLRATVHDPVRPNDRPVGSMPRPQVADTTPLNPVVATADESFDWGDASVGAFGALGLCLLLAGCLLFVGKQRKHRPAAL